MEQLDAAIADESWEEVYRRAQPRLLAYARRRLPADAAEDAVSETMTRAVASAARYRDRGLGVDAWLFGICRNVVLDTQRRAARHRSRQPVAWSPDESGPLDAMLRDEEAGTLRLAFARLSDADREVLELRVVAGLNAEAVAVVLGRRVGAIRTAQSRALTRLRALLVEADEGRS